MQTTTDLFSRLTCNNIYEITALVADTTDDSFNTGTGYNLLTSTFLDISRCSLLTERSFTKLNDYSNLVYLDISYTNIKSIAGIVDNCPSIKSFNLAGVNPTSFAPIEYMTSLEVLSLRCSSFTDTNLLRTLCLLRSLDLGQTFITSIAPLSSLNKRLEELAIDETTLKSDAASVEKEFKAIISMQSLKLLNVCKSSLEAKSDDIITSFPIEFCLETEIRRYQYIRAICDHDDALFYRLFSSGANIDQLLINGPFLAELWETHCKRPRQQTPFYLSPESINSEELDVCFITSLHIALLFGNVRAAKVIYNHTGQFFRITNHYVYDDSRYISRIGEKQTTEFIEQCRHRSLITNIVFCEVKVETGANGVKRLVRDIDRPSKLAKIDFQLPQLPVAIFESNSLRITTKMMDKKVYNWKVLCKDIYEEYAFMLDPNYWIKKSAKRKGMKNADGEAEEGEGGEEEEEEEEEEENAVVNVDDLGSLGDGLESLGNDAPADANRDRDSTSFAGGGADGLVAGYNGDTSRPSTVKANNEDIELKLNSKPGENENGLFVEPVQKKKKKMKMIEKVLKSKAPVFSWREHALVIKITGPPIVHKSTVSNQDINVLGKRSYWMESRTHFLASRFDAEQELIELDKTKWNKLSKEAQNIVKNSIAFRYPFKAKIPPYYKPKDDNMSIVAKMESVQKEIFEKNNLAFKMANVKINYNESGSQVDDSASVASFESA